MPYIGQSLTEGTRREYSYVATAGQTVFPAVYTVGAVDVHQNGILLPPSDYTATDGTTVVFATGCAVDDEVVIHCHNTFSVADAVSASAGGTFSGPVVANDGLTVDKATDGTILDLKGTTSQLIYQKYDTTNYLWNMENELLFGTYAEKDLRIGTNGGEKVRVTSSGNVGIGTQDPAVKLEVSDGTVDVAVGYPAGNIAYAGTLTNHPFALITNNGNRMNIGSDGQITMSGGWPFHTGTYYGTLTSDSGGNAYINLSSWSWGAPESYRRVWKVMIAVVDMGGGGLNAVADGTLSGPYDYNYLTSINVTFNANGATGGRWFTISSLAANTQYRYTFKAMPIDSYFTGWGV